MAIMKFHPNNRWSMDDAMEIGMGKKTKYAEWYCHEEIDGVLWDVYLCYDRDWQREDLIKELNGEEVD